MKQKLQNWFYYYKWYVVIGALMLFFLIQWAGNLTGLFEKKPDVQIACVLNRPLSAEAQHFLEDTFAQAAEDYNSDGKVTVRIHSYLTADESSTTEAQQSSAYSEVTLIGDINDCESYFFLMDDPDAVQVNWQILAQADGSCPAPTDYSTDDKTVPFTALSFSNGSGNSAAGTDTRPPEHMTEEEYLYLTSLRFGRRCFYTEKHCKYEEKLSALWSLLTGL